MSSADPDLSRSQSHLRVDAFPVDQNKAIFALLQLHHMRNPHVTLRRPDLGAPSYIADLIDLEFVRFATAELWPSVPALQDILCRINSTKGTLEIDNADLRQTISILDMGLRPHDYREWCQRRVGRFCPNGMRC